jgi:hypothetical protein
VRWWRSGPDAVPVGLPDLSGGGWPDEAATGRPGFATATYRELGVRHAFDLEAHAVADRVLDGLLPHLPLQTSAEDEPYVRKLLLTAARLGAGLALVERTLPAPAPGTVDRHLAGALWEARRTLPEGQRPDGRAAAAYVLLAGFWVGRDGPGVVDRLVQDLVDDGPGPQGRPGLG